MADTISFYSCKAWGEMAPINQLLLLLLLLLLRRFGGFLIKYHYFKEMHGNSISVHFKDLSQAFLSNTYLIDTFYVLDVVKPHYAYETNFFLVD